MGKPPLEVFKFGLYVTIPVVLTLAFAASPQNLQAIITNRAYVVYPNEGPRPPNADEIRKLRQQ